MGAAKKVVNKVLGKKPKTSAPAPAPAPAATVATTTPSVDGNV